MELDKINLQTTWNDAAGSLNNNFDKLKLAIQSMLIEEKDKTYTHIQNEASDTWIVEHGLGKHPSVTVVDSAGTKVYGEVHYDNESQLTITFTAAFSGKAYLN